MNFIQKNMKQIQVKQTLHIKKYLQHTKRKIASRNSMYKIMTKSYFYSKHFLYSPQRHKALSTLRKLF